MSGHFLYPADMRPEAGGSEEEVSSARAATRGPIWRPPKKSKSMWSTGLFSFLCAGSQVPSARTWRASRLEIKAGLCKRREGVGRC